ncbi:serine--tRNA ligase [Candidatus Gracilibacteria bacterium]|nr:MAG: serine--tRNA ligase [Candidatus Gracilibacteria bacterium]
MNKVYKLIIKNMLDIKIIRNQIDLVKEVIQKRNMTLDVDAFLEIDTQKLELILKVDELRELKNKVSKEIPSLQADQKAKKLEEMKEVSEKLKVLEEKQKEVEAIWQEMYYKFPNLLDKTAAIGPTDEDGVVEYTFLEPTKFDFEPKAHYEIGETKDWIDTEKGSEISGSRFWYLKGDLVLLEFAIINFVMAKLVSKGFSPILPPVLVKEKAMFGTGFFPAGEDGIYSVNPGEDDLYLVGTSEVPVTSYHSGEVLDLTEPKKYVAFSPCFRREAGSAGKDMRGILRGHQFDKVEMVVFCKPEDSKKMHDFMVSVEQEVWEELGIPYQKVNIASGDLGNPAMKKYDLEAWMPGQQKYREVTSCSNIGEFQSRRLGIKCKDENGKSVYAHTLNGTVSAIGRCLIAIIENYQTADGNVKIPEVLVPFMGGKKEI